MELLYIFLIPISSIFGLSMKDKDRERHSFMVFLFLLNTVLSLIPLLGLYFITYPDNLAIGYIYLTALPILAIFQVILILLKIVHSRSK